MCTCKFCYRRHQICYLYYGNNYYFQSLGDVPELYEDDQLEKVIVAWRVKHMEQETRTSKLYESFIRTVKDNLRVIICMNPTLDSLRSVIINN